MRLRIETTPHCEFAIGLLGPLALLVYPASWTKSEWASFLDHLERGAKEELVTSVFVILPGRVPGALERKQLAERTPIPADRPAMRQAVVTANPMMRGALTALGWLMSKPDYELRSFAPREWREALTWLKGTASFDLDEAERCLRDTVSAAKQDFARLTA